MEDVVVKREETEMKQEGQYYHLCKVINAHEKDVRCIASYKEGFVTGSRDKTGKLFIPGQTEGNFIEAMLFRAAENFVSSVCVLNPTAEEAAKGEKPKIFLGSNDANIYVFTEDESLSILKLEGHSSTVSALAANDSNGRILSGSWDMTAILWEGKNKLCVIFGHQQAIWATAFLGNTDVLLTASADQTIKAWSSSANLMETFIGHTDAVRSLSSINDEIFMSCANDGTLKRWKLGSGLLKSYDCHATYIYSMAWITEPGSDNKIGFITCAEDRTVRLFIKGNRVQVIPLPGDTSWAVTTIKRSIKPAKKVDGSNGVNGSTKDVTDDIAIASSTGMVFIFSKEPSRRASDDEQQVFKGLFDSTQFPPTDIGSRDILECPEQLESLAKHDGEKGYVRNGEKTDVFMYTLAEEKWIKVGFISGSDKKTLGKNEYEGKMYDYLINVDMEDGQPPLKLPFNIGDNPRRAAEDFVQRHSIPLAFLDTIEQFIISNVCTDKPAPNPGQ